MYRHHEDEIIVSNRATTMNSFVAPLIPIMAVVLIAFLIIGVALPVLPLHVHQDLGFGAFIVGLVTGSQFGASLLSRTSAGHYADRRGPKRAVVIGLMTAIVAGAPLPPVALFRPRTDGLGDHPAVRASALWRGRELHHHRRCQLGTRSRRRKECGTGHRLDRHGNVRGVGARGPARDRALFCRRFCRCRDRNPHGQAGFRVAPQFAGSVSAHVGRPLLLLTLVSSLWLRRQLKHRRLLSLS